MVNNVIIMPYDDNSFSLELRSPLKWSFLCWEWSVLILHKILHMLWRLGWWSTYDHHTQCNLLKYSAMARNWTRATGRTDSEIHSLYHWAIMTRATKRTDSEIHSLSHWAIMPRATERTDSEIHSLSHWAIMTRAMERTDSEILSLSHWAIMTNWH